MLPLNSIKVNFFGEPREIDNCGYPGLFYPCKNSIRKVSFEKRCSKEIYLIVISAIDILVASQKHVYNIFMSKDDDWKMIYHIPGHHTLDSFDFSSTKSRTMYSILWLYSFPFNYWPKSTYLMYSI